MDRRVFIASAMAALGVPAAAARASARQALDRNIAVIGAGIAGLAAARRLRDQGARVTVLEATHRLGGRLATSRAWPDQPIDLGASWIHGVDSNPVTALGRAAGLSTTPTDYDIARIYAPRGGRLNRQAREKLWNDEDWLDRFAERPLSFSMAEACETEPQGALMDALAERLNLDTDSPAKRRRTYFLINSAIEHEFGADAEELSRCFWNEGETFEGGDAFVLNGFERLAAHIGRDVDVRFGQAVTAVELTGGGKVRVTTGEAAETFDALVVTVPLGVLKAGDIRFQPGLPDWKRAAIDEIGMGVLNKCVMRFPHVDWPARWQIFNRVGRRRGEWSEFVNLAAYGDAPVLMGFNAGSYARTLEGLDDRETANAMFGALRGMFGNSLPRPDATLISRWAANPWSHGSYSYASVDTRHDSRARLARDVDGLIYFAGEATSLSGPSTVHGALQSGWAAAADLIGRLG